MDDVSGPMHPETNDADGIGGFRDLSPARRAALDALEREFSDLLSRQRQVTTAADAEHRADVAQRLLNSPLR